MTDDANRIANPVHHFVLVAEGRDLLDDEVLEALYEAGCTDASIGHRTVEFDREAPTRWDAIQSAIRDVTTITGVRVVDVRDSMDTLPGSRTERALA